MAGGGGGGNLLGSITLHPSQVEQRLEPAKRAAHSVHKRLQACLQGQSGADMDKRVVSRGPREGGAWQDTSVQREMRLGLGLPSSLHPRPQAGEDHSVTRPLGTLLLRP